MDNANGLSNSNLSQPTDASDVAGAPGAPNDGGTDGFNAAVQSMIEAFNLATERNIYLRTLTTELGTILNAAKKDVNPK